MIVSNKLYDVEGLLCSLPARNLRTPNVLEAYGAPSRRFRVRLHSFGQNKHRVVKNKHQVPRNKQKCING